MYSADSHFRIPAGGAGGKAQHLRSGDGHLREGRGGYAAVLHQLFHPEKMGLPGAIIN